MVEMNKLQKMCSIIIICKCRLDRFYCTLQNEPFCYRTSRGTGIWFLRTVTEALYLFITENRK